MAALCTGISYGLSQSQLNDNKELIFVKLTDSAYRAIEEYQKNQKNLSTHPTIQFLRNEGYLSFPSVANNLGQKFSFSISEQEGPQGSFECIQQSQGQLEILGPLPSKMRIHAKEDVYEATRHRMAVAEENQKNKCTREIKPNQTDIGRKVKLKNSFIRSTNIPNNNTLINNNNINNINNNKRDSSLNSLSSNNINNNNIINLNINNNNNNNNINNNNIINNNLISPTTTTTSILTTSITTASTTTLSASSLSSSSSASSLLSTQTIPTTGTTTIISTIKDGSILTSSIPTQLVTTIPTISKLNNNNNLVTPTTIQNTSTTIGGGGGGTLSTSSIIPSNLSIQTTKIPQQQSIITNGNGGSGSSCNTTTQLSSSIISSLNGGLVPNRNGNSRTSGGRGGGRGTDIMKRSIKDRLVHLLAVRPYKKPELCARIFSEGVRDREKNGISTVLKTISYMSDNTYHLHRHIWNDVHEDWPFYTEQDRQCLKRRKPQNLTPPLSSDGGSSTSGQSPTSTHNGSPPPAVKRPLLNNTEKPLEGPIIKKQRISHFKKEVVNQDNTRRGVTDSRDSTNMNPRSREADELPQQNYFIGPNVTPNAQESEDSGMSLSYSVLGSEAAKRITAVSVTVSTDDQERDNYDDEVDEMTADSKKLLNGNGTNHDFSQFTRIASIEQRRKYKTEFDNDYTEYRKLHAEIEQTSKRFEQLGKRLRSEKHNDNNYKAIQRQILNEYRQKMRDSNHQEAKMRFHYLHQKLSHIKRLVNDYDTTLTKGKPQQNY